MSEEPSNPSAGWYVRRGSQVRGPFPARQVSKYVLLGRIRQSDEVSRDQQHWQRLADVPSLIPEAVRSGASEEVIQQQRRREDERGAGAGQGGEGGPAPGVERRTTPEPESMQQHRQHKAQLIRDLREDSARERRFTRVAIPLAVAAAAGLLVLGVQLRPVQEGGEPDCAAAAAPGVNWSNCNLEQKEAAKADLEGARVRNANLREADLMGSTLEGADLAYSDLTRANLGYADLTGAGLKGATLRGADLTYADLSGADLTYADLTRAQLGGAELEGADLSGAVWPDGRTCAGGSTGGCIPTQ